MYAPVLKQVGERSTGDRFTVPVMTFDDHWSGLLSAFGELDPQEPTWTELDWFVESNGGPCRDFTLDFDDLPLGIKDGLIEMSASLWHESMDETHGLIHLTGMMDRVGEQIGTFMVALKEAMLVYTGYRSVAMKVPIGPSSGSSDESFPPHQDLFPCLFNLSVYAKPAPGGAGASVFLPAWEYLRLARKLLPAWIFVQVDAVVRRRTAWTPEHYVAAFDRGDCEAHNDPYGLFKAGFAAAIKVPYGHGEGYWIREGGDGMMHGREPFDRKKYNAGRMHRLTYDTESSWERRAALGGNWVV